MHLDLAKFNENLTRWDKIDFIVFFGLIPAVLALVFLLPPDLKGPLVLHAENPTALSVFFSNYTHEDTMHFLGNFAGYLLLMTLIFSTETNRKFFHKMAFLLFILLPLFLAPFTVYFLKGPVIGFSGIVAALTGYLVYSVYRYLKTHYKLPLTSSMVVLIFLINVAIYLIALQKAENLALLTVSIALIAVFFYPQRKVYSQLFRNLLSDYSHFLKTKVPKKSFKFLTALFTLVMLFSLTLLIPANIVEGDHYINILAHYIGYSFGLFLPGFIEEIQKFRSKK